MQCVICKTGETKKGKTSFTVEKSGAYLVFSNVPADVCNTCGEAYFSLQIAQELELRASEHFKNGKEIELIRLAS